MFPKWEYVKQVVPADEIPTTRGALAANRWGTEAPTVNKLQVATSSRLIHAKKPSEQKIIYYSSGLNPDICRFTQAYIFSLCGLRRDVSAS